MLWNRTYHARWDPEVSSLDVSSMKPATGSLSMLARQLLCEASLLQEPKAQLRYALHQAYE